MTKALSTRAASIAWRCASVSSREVKDLLARPLRASAMSNRSFINRTAEEGRQRLVVGRVVLLDAGFVGCFERIEHGIHRLVGIGGLALPLHRVEIIHIGLVGLLIVAEQTHRISETLSLDAF